MSMIKYHRERAEPDIDLKRRRYKRRQIKSKAREYAGNADETAQSEAEEYRSADEDARRITEEGIRAVEDAADEASHAVRQRIKFIREDENVSHAAAGGSGRQDPFSRNAQVGNGSSGTKTTVSREGLGKEEYISFGRSGTKEMSGKSDWNGASPYDSKKGTSYYQKKHYQREYANGFRARRAGGTSSVATEVREEGGRIKRLIKKAGDIVRNNGPVIAMIAVNVVLAIITFSLLGTMASAVSGSGQAFMASTYLSSDDEIHAAEDYFHDKEKALQDQVSSMESRHPGYDEFRYQVDEIGHNPYQLISYLNVKYGEFTKEDVTDELDEIFGAQYSITTRSFYETVTETKTVRVGESLGTVTTSGYCSCSICCGKWAGGATASGVMPRDRHTIAVDMNTPIVPMGTKVIMNGTEYVVEDTGPLSRYGVAFDVYYDDHNMAQAHGHKRWEAYLADDNGTNTVEVTTTERRHVFEVTVRNKGLDGVLRERMDDEEKEWYDILNNTYGNRDYLFDLSTLTIYGEGGYTIPPEALSDAKFANMIHEAERYLGVPYVWGGYSPSGFDCSGFVSYVINHSGNGWNVGRLTAEGLRGATAYVPPSQARPGDLIFFQGTYATSGASHVGIYVGNGMMIHCGHPVQYASVNTEYWQSHFLSYGRLP